MPFPLKSDLILHKEVKIAYRPRTCPFCNFWGPRKRPDGKFSCDMCGLEWKPEQDKRDKDKQ